MDGNQGAFLPRKWKCGDQGAFQPQNRSCGNWGFFNLDLEER